MRNRPSRRARDKAQTFLQSEVIDFINDPINIISKTSPIGENIRIMRNHPSGCLMLSHLGIYAKSPLRHLSNSPHLGARQRRADLAPCVGEELQRPRCGDTGINLAQTPRRGISRIFIF